MSTSFTALNRRHQGSVQGEGAASQQLQSRGLGQSHREVDLTFVDRAPIRVRARRILPHSAAVAFRGLADAEAWPKWLAMRRVVWTSPEPHGVGSTRDVYLGEAPMAERFILWRPGRRLAFRVEQSAVGSLVAMVEDYELRPIDEDACEVTWRIGLELGGVLRLLSPVVSLGLYLLCRRGLANFDSYLAEAGEKYT